MLGIHKRFTIVKAVVSYSTVTSIFPNIAYVLLFAPEILVSCTLWTETPTTGL